MTEEEAKTKWCPLTSRANGTLQCIGSACMAWRWASDFNLLVAKFPDKNRAAIKAIAIGYCGLGGEP